jgi:hypothetical protein
VPDALPETDAPPDGADGVVVVVLPETLRSVRSVVVVVDPGDADGAGRSRVVVRSVVVSVQPAAMTARRPTAQAPDVIFFSISSPARGTTRRGSRGVKE